MRQNSILGCEVHITRVVAYARTRLANDAKGKGGERQFNGLVDVYVKTLKSDGIQGLYRGFTISAVGIFIYRGMYFGLYDTLKPLILGADAVVGISFLLGWAVTVTAGLMSYCEDRVSKEEGPAGDEDSGEDEHHTRYLCKYTYLC